MRTQISRGFNLIELMMALVIIAIVATIAMVSYSKQIGRSQSKSALAEVSPAKSQFEIKINDQQPISQPQDIGLTAAGSRCRNVQVSLNEADGNGAISCEVVGGEQVDGRRIILSRSSNGIWTCGSELTDDYRPAECQPL